MNNKKIIIIILCIAVVISALLIIFPIIFKDSGPDMSMNLYYTTYPELPAGTSYSHWETVRLVNLTDRDFAEYSSLNDLFSNINTSINKTEAIEKEIRISSRSPTHTPIISGIITDKIRDKYIGRVLNWNGDYYVIHMPTS